MTEDQKQALIDFLKFLIAGSAGQHKQIYEIALAALTAQPGLVLRPFGEDSQNTFIKCENNHPLAMKLFTRPTPAVSLANWIECSERLPQDREQVILWDSDIGEHTSGHYSQQTGKFYSTGMIIDNEITHWLPAPAAPEVE